MCCSWSKPYLGAEKVPGEQGLKAKPAVQLALSQVGESSPVWPSIHWCSEVGSSVLPMSFPDFWSLLPLPAQLPLGVMVHQEFAPTSVRLSVRFFCNTTSTNFLNFLRNWIQRLEFIWEGIMDRRSWALCPFQYIFPHVSFLTFPSTHRMTLIATSYWKRSNTKMFSETSELMPCRYDRNSHESSILVCIEISPALWCLPAFAASLVGHWICVPRRLLLTQL